MRLKEKSIIRTPISLVTNYITLTRDNEKEADDESTRADRDKG